MCGAKVVSSSESGVETLGYGGVEDRSLLELRGDLSERRARDGHAEDGAGGGADDLGVPRVDGVGREEDLLRAEGFGGADEGAEVAGVLQAFEDERDGLWLRPSAAARVGMSEGCGDALRGGGFDGAGEDVAAEDEGVARFDCGECGAVENVLAAFAQEEGFEGEAGANGLGDEVLAFEAEELAGLRGLAAEGGAQSFDAGVGLARDGCGRWHDKEASCVETQCTRRVADDRAERASLKRTDGIKS